MLSGAASRELACHKNVAYEEGKQVRCAPHVTSMSRLGLMPEAGNDSERLKHDQMLVNNGNDHVPLECSERLSKVTVAIGQHEH